MAKPPCQYSGPMNTDDRFGMSLDTMRCEYDPRGGLHNAPMCDKMLCVNSGGTLSVPQSARAYAFDYTDRADPNIIPIFDRGPNNFATLRGMPYLRRIPASKMKFLDVEATAAALRGDFRRVGSRKSKELKRLERTHGKILSNLRAYWRSSLERMQRTGSKRRSRRRRRRRSRKGSRSRSRTRRRRRRSRSKRKRSQKRMRRKPVD